MTEDARIAVDTSKHVFTVHGIDEKGHGVLRRNLRRAGFAGFLKELPPTQTAMEACGGSYQRAGELQAVDHEVLLRPPQYVKPFIKRGKNDRNDAKAICTAAGQADMAHVPVNSAGTRAAAISIGFDRLECQMRG